MTQIQLGNENNVIEIYFNNRCIIDTNINITLGQPGNPITINNIPFLNSLNDKNVNYISYNTQTQKIFQIKPITDYIYKPTLQPSNTFYLDSINAQNIKFLSLYCPTPERLLYFGGLNINIENLNVTSDFNLQDLRGSNSVININIQNGIINNFLLNRKLFITGYKIPLIINNIQSEGKVYFDTSVAITGLLQATQSGMGAIGYNTTTKTLTTINSGYKLKEYDNLSEEKFIFKKNKDLVEYHKIDEKITRLEKIYRKLLYIKNEIGQKNEK